MIIAAPGVGSGAVGGGMRWEWVGGEGGFGKNILPHSYIANFFSKVEQTLEHV